MKRIACSIGHVADETAVLCTRRVLLCFFRNVSR
jgi:hypothetical protein